MGSSRGPHRVGCGGSWAGRGCEKPEKWSNVGPDILFWLRHLFALQEYNCGGSSYVFTWEIVACCMLQIVFNVPTIEKCWSQCAPVPHTSCQLLKQSKQDGKLIVISIDGFISRRREGWFTHWSVDSMTESVLNWHDMSLGYIFCLDR